VAERTTGPISFRVLGPVEAERDGELLPLGGARQRALLSLLLLEAGRSVGRDWLIDELWAGEPPDGADTTLRSYVSRLRTALGDGPSITATPAGYSADVDAERVDARRFERLIRDAESALARRNPGKARDLARDSLRLWRAAPFGELASDGALRVEAERLEELRLRAIELRLEAEIALGEGGAAVDELDALVRQHPFRERLWHHLMVALYRAGRQADALAAYKRARTELRQQLGLEPGEDLQELQRQILRHEVPPAASSTGGHMLPASLTTFIGRDVELVEIARLLRTSRLVTLVGVGGVGKTRLALEAARARALEHADGVVFVDLAPLTEPELLTSQVASALDIREQGGASPSERLARHLRDADLLLVLDNCEHLRTACAELVHELLSTCPGLRVLATSREVVGVPGEVDYVIPPLGLPDSAAQASAWRRSEAVQLFIARAREARPDLPDDDATIETIARICADLDGLPLGIELAAARARALSPAEIGDRLHDRFRFLVSWRRLATARHRTMREAMDWSYDLLDPEARRLLAELSVFVNGFTLEAIEEVSTGPAQDRALEVLELLVDASLVLVDQGAEPTRYRLLETVREYGAARLEATGASDDLRDRHARYFTAAAEAAWHPLRSSGVQAAWVARVDWDRDNFRAALTWSLDRGHFDQALRISESLWWYWWIRGELSEGRAWLQRSLAGATSSALLLRARGLLGSAGLGWAIGDTVGAEVAAQEAASLLDELGDHLQAGSARNTLGLLAYGRGDNARARELFEIAIAKYEAADVEPRIRQRNLGIAIDNLGSVAHDLGDDADARRRYEEARTINIELGDEEGVAMNDLHLAVLDAEAGDWPTARRRLLDSLALYRRVEFPQYAAECLECAAVVANGLGAPGEAAFVLGAASHMREPIGNPPVPFMARLREREAAVASTSLGAEAFRAAEAEGKAMPVAAAIDRALEFLRTAGPGNAG
jgi:predicted ATPase/DNA-binding SARP family transcriptional activator